LRFRIVGQAKLRDGVLRGWIRGSNHPLFSCGDPSLLSQSKRYRPRSAKDAFAAKGYPTTWGTAPYRNQTFDFDAAIVKRMADAGAVLIGKLAMVELVGGLGYNTADASFTGPGRTPWNPDLSVDKTPSDPSRANSAAMKSGRSKSTLS